MDEQLEKYLLNNIPVNDQWVLNMEKQAKTDRIPIMDPLSIHFLEQMIRIMKPLRILEIGTGIGYSALRIHQAHPDAHITTIERDYARYEHAIKNIAKQEKQEQINVIYGDALEKLKELKVADQSYDFVLIDASKSQYKNFFQLADPITKKSGVIISDNVLFKGYVVKQSLEKNRYQRITQKIRKYNAWLVNHPNYITSIIPIGDGIAISYKV